MVSRLNIYIIIPTHLVYDSISKFLQFQLTVNVVAVVIGGFILLLFNFKMMLFSLCQCLRDQRLSSQGTSTYRDFYVLL